MNWTGGQLHRHSKNTAKGVVQRQKQHFAKVRTRLQNGTDTVRTSVRPSSLFNGEAELAGSPQLFGSGSSRHRSLGEERRTAEGTRTQHIQRETSLQTRRRFGTKAFRKEPPDCSQQFCNVPEGVSATSHGQSRSKTPKRVKRQPRGGNEREVLLEVKRRKLLSRPDWVGLAPSHPVDMHFKSQRNKHRAARRRKPEGYCSAYYHHTDGARDATLGAGAGEKGVVGDISIRIGSDALASQTQMQPTDHATSRVTPTSQGDSSDPMLFDHEEPCRQSKGSMQSSRSVSRGHQTTGDRLEQHTADSNEQLPSGAGPSDDPGLGCRFPIRNAMLSDSRITPLATSCDQTLRVSMEGEGHELAYAGTRNHENDPVLDVVQVTGNTGRRLYLVSADCSDLSEMAMLQSKSLKKHDVQGPAHTDVSRCDHSGLLQYDPKGRGLANCTSRLHPVVNHALWEAFLGIREVDSSSSGASCAIGSGLVDTAFTGSQHATLGDPDTIAHPINLDEDKAKGWQGEIAHDYVTKTPSQDMSTGEEAWRAFVFAGDDSSDMEPMSKTLTEGVTSSCHAVASSIHTPLDANTWIPRTGVSEDVRERASGNFLSPRQGSGSPMTSSPAWLDGARRCRWNARQVADGANMAWTGGFAAHSVSQASLFNSVSDDMHSDGAGVSLQDLGFPQRSGPLRLNLQAGHGEKK